MEEWKTFYDRLPVLGMHIEVLTDDKKVHRLGAVKKLENLGGGWIGMDADHAVGVAVRPDYQWRELPD